MKQESPFRLQDDELLKSLFNRFGVFSYPRLNTRIAETYVDWVYLTFHEPPELRDFVASGLNYESIADFAQAFGVSEQFFDEAEGVLGRLVKLYLILELVNSRETLLDVGWLERAKEPQQLKAEMRKVLRHIESVARAIYGAANHRKSIHEARDRELWRLKRKHPKWTQGQLALTFGLSPSAAGLAYEREAKRQKRRLNRLHELVLAFLADDCDSDLRDLPILDGLLTTLVHLSPSPRYSTHKAWQSISGQADLAGSG